MNRPALPDVKLLFDHNLAPRLAKDLQDLFPGSTHVRNVGLQEADDIVIWDFASANDLTIVTKDDDFRQRSFLRGPPPKVVWVRLGNCTTAEMGAALIARRDDIFNFGRDPSAALLLLTRQVS